MNYTLNTLPEIIAQVVHFSRDDYQNGEYPDDCAWNAGYIVACMLAQHTVEGNSGVETEQGYAGMKATEDMPYDERVQLARQLVDYWGGTKSQPAGEIAEAKPIREAAQMEYKILVASDAAELYDEVNAAIRSGWTPLGGVSVAQVFKTWENERKGYTEYETQSTYAQAMVRVPANT